MAFTCIVMTMLIVWAIRQICREIGLTDVARHKIQKKFGEDDEE